jgi:uncharacterized protein (TIGR00255 family)
MTICSMTGFANVQRKTPLGTLMVELRSVNHRYLELQLRLDDVLRPFEPVVREALSKSLGRGKVECRINLITTSGLPPSSELSAAGLEQIARLNQAILQRFPDSLPLSVADILRAPGVLITEEISSLDLEADVLAALNATLTEMTASRSREGEKLAALILERATQIEALIEKIKPLMPTLIKTYQDKLAAKLHELLESADENRVHQELAIFAQKIDVDEELGRLSTHLHELRRILAAGGTIGKRLDFLMQELNREANTLGSKSVASETSQVAMELKVLIEQMREQIQNIE